jgi:predicted DNA-binding transcriptional regulator AlpA
VGPSPDHPLAWTFEHADLGGRGPIPVPVDAWDERADQVVAMGAAELHPWNLVTVDGVAGLLGVSESTVRAYLARRQMPEPLLRIGRVPVWSRQQIEAWHASRTRARPVVAPARPATGDEDVADEGGTDDDR